jgi:hypothetical protein
LLPAAAPGLETLPIGNASVALSWRETCSISGAGLKERRRDERERERASEREQGREGPMLRSRDEVQTKEMKKKKLSTSSLHLLLFL